MQIRNEHNCNKKKLFYVILVTSMVLSVSTPWKISPNASTSWWKLMNDSSTVVSAWTELIITSPETLSEFLTRAESVHSSSTTTSAFQTSSVLINSSYDAIYALEASITNVSFSNTSEFSTELKSSSFSVQDMFLLTTEYSNFQRDEFLNKSNLQCFNCFGSEVTCGKQRSSSDQLSTCRSNRGENTCMTVVSFDSNPTTYQRGCAKYICPEAAQQTFICEQSSYCYRCCMTSLCNTETYKSSSCFHQISATVEILYTCLLVLFIVVLP